MAIFNRIDPGGDLNTGKSIFQVATQQGQVELTQEDATSLMRWLRSFLEPLPSLHGRDEREKTLRQLVDELFTIAEPGAVKNALWTRYQSVEGASPRARATGQPRLDIETADAEAQARQDWSNDE